MDLLGALLAYATTFTATYPVLFGEARVFDIFRELESSDFIPGASQSTNDRYFRFTRICIRFPELVPFINELNDRGPLQVSDMARKLSLSKVSSPQLSSLS